MGFNKLELQKINIVLAQTTDPTRKKELEAMKVELLRDKEQAEIHRALIKEPKHEKPKYT